LLVKWNVSHHFLGGLHIRRKIKGYNKLGISLKYTNNKLMSLEHEVIYKDSMEPNEVIAKSLEQLKLFLEILHYLRGVPFDIKSTANKLEAAPLLSTSITNVSIDIKLSANIILPKLKTLLKPPDRLLTWVKLANDALDSTDNEFAIRNYYMIWEDMKADSSIDNWPPEANDLRQIRNFVSHGGKLRKATCTFVESKLGMKIERYDPSVPAVMELVRLCRITAQNLIDSEMEKIFNK
jgi:hypothetical protein